MATSKTQKTSSPLIRREALYGVQRPPVLKFRKLLTDLLRATEAAETGEDELAVVLRCVVSLIRFLEGDLTIKGTGIVRPLGRLAIALRDLGRGARPPLFFDRPDRNVGRPKDITIEAARGHIAAAASFLIEQGEAAAAAADFIAATLRELHINYRNGKPISARQILRWRHETGGPSPERAERTYKDVLAKYAAAPHGGGRNWQRNLVLGSLMSLRDAGF